MPISTFEWLPSASAMCGFGGCWIQLWVSLIFSFQDGYQCRCVAGFKDLRPESPGRLCKQMVDECARAELNSCDRNAKCMDEEDGYRCECKPGFADVSPSPTLPGRACRPVVYECLEPKLNDCDPRAKCTDLPGGKRRAKFRSSKNTLCFLLQHFLNAKIHLSMYFHRRLPLRMPCQFTWHLPIRCIPGPSLPRVREWMLDGQTRLRSPGSMPRQRAGIQLRMPARLHRPFAQSPASAWTGLR